MLFRSRRMLARITWGTTGVGALALLVTWLVPWVQQAADQMVVKFFAVERVTSMGFSFLVRFNYILKLVYALVESRGLGLGIEQYGYFWKDIYLRHIDYQPFDRGGEVQRALTIPGDYMKPWSVILGVGVDLGLLGMALLAGFFVQLYRQLAGPRQRGMFFACLVGLAGAYPIVTPHLWLVLILMTGSGARSAKEPL